MGQSSSRYVNQCQWHLFNVYVKSNTTRRHLYPIEFQENPDLLLKRNYTEISKVVQKPRDKTDGYVKHLWSMMDDKLLLEVLEASNNAMTLYWAGLLSWYSQAPV